MAKKSAGEKKTSETIVAYKGFESDWACRDFQYEVGNTYKHEGEVKPCQSGFHACTDPFDVLRYYGYDGKFAEVELGGETKTHEGDMKIAAAEITIKAELSIPEFIQRGIDYIFSHIDWDGAEETNTGYRSAATNTGYRSAATVEGKDSVAMASGYQGRVAGAKGCTLFLVERGDGFKIINAWAGIVGRDGIKPNVFYTLEDGKPVAA